MMYITTGLRSGAAFAKVVERPSHYSPCSPFLTPTTACWLAAKRYGGVWRSTVRGKRQRLR
jgi:hypothetical protein